MSNTSILKADIIDLDKTDKKIINMIQLDFPIVTEPFKFIAEQIGIPQEEVIQRLNRLKNLGGVRRIGPILNTKKMGGVNTLVGIKIPEDRINEASSFINKYCEVSHNYQRTFDFNVWFTVSAPTRERIDTILNEIKSEFDCPILDLPTETQFKIQVFFNL